ncbi:Site-specific recombinase XerD [Anaerocolumna jejuensis DSM 15929]|uniref:Site-specific recombinase XerD n=1 Tax=Anaerocolumna jejuensis DSM 15929 TaxID=1121322 RepID=A0A1M7DKF1_9FIRM|nr:tyrosine-type recombinase/integrase [Anaerocolumna jejuensis]SHL79649.1 Site-specific recombinase XerD [Anaerocolumna jejuensis DSM 15929]SHL80268.1 Site-specific recombinase XerD [Anaerocolumna jejuensis DSM 15929]
MKTISLNKTLFFSQTCEYLNVYLPKQAVKSERTIKTYKDALTVFRCYLTKERGLSIRTFKFEDCTRDLLLDYLSYLSSEHTESSCNNRMAAIKSYLWYVADGEISMQSIALMASKIPRIREPKITREIIHEADFSALLFAPPRTKTGMRDRTIMILLYDSAIRVSELLALDTSSLNLSASPAYISVHGKGDKERIVVITERTVSHLQQYLNLYHKSDPKEVSLFYTSMKGRTDRMSAGNIARIINKYADMIRAEHPNLPKQIYPHMFRRTRATNLYQDGVELELISRILGHSSTQTTRIYATPSIDMMRKAMEPKDQSLSVEKELWLDDEDELARLCGIR